jgi:hypothetical protein
MRRRTPFGRPLAGAARRRFRKIEYDFHVRAFGEEMARVNFMPLAKRKAYVADMVDHARRKGVKFEKPALGVTP